jgi:hypothetical protein
MEKCPFCSVAFDKDAAAAASEVQENVNRACSDASYLRVAAVIMFVFVGLSFFPFLPGTWGFLITFVVVIVLLARWQLKFGRLRTDDSDYQRARKHRNLAIVLWLLAIPVLLLKFLRLATIFDPTE